MMSSSHSNDDVIQILGLCIPPILLLVGNIGCICNYITLTDRQLCRSSCTIYFLASSMVDFFILNLNLFSRWIHDGFLIDRKQIQSLFYCKFRNYFVIVLPIISTSFIILASIDRWAQTSLNINQRKFSNRRIAYCLILIITLFWLIILSHQLIFYKILNGKCDGNSKIYDIFHGIFNIFTIGIIPSLLLAIFGYLTLKNIRRSFRRVNLNLNRKQNQLIRMALVQVITTICLTFPYVLIMSYITISKYFYSQIEINKNKKIVNFLDLITRDLWYLNYTKSFYIYTLSSTLFKNIFIQRIKKLFKCFRQNIILPEQQHMTNLNTIHIV